MNMMMGLLGGSPDTSIKINGAYPNAAGFNSNAVATYRIANDKKIYLGTGTFTGFVPASLGTFAEYETWCGAGPAASAYDARATLMDQSGDINYGAYGVASFAGTTGAWLNLATTRDWSVMSYAGLVGQFQNQPLISRTLTIEIRNATTLRRVAVATVVLTAQKYS